MKPEAHRQRAQEVLASRAKLRDETDVALYVNATFHIAHQTLAAYLLETFDEHHDKHQTIPGALRRRQLFAAAAAFQGLETLRAGRWYGARANGETMHRADELLKTIMAEVEPDE